MINHDTQIIHDRYKEFDQKFEAIYKIKMLICKICSTLLFQFNVFSEIGNRHKEIIPNFKALKTCWPKLKISMSTKSEFHLTYQFSNNRRNIGVLGIIGNELIIKGVYEVDDDNNKVPMIRMIVLDNFLYNTVRKDLETLNSLELTLFELIS